METDNTNEIFDHFINYLSVAMVKYHNKWQLEEAFI